MSDKWNVNISGNSQNIFGDHARAEQYNTGQAKEVVAKFFQEIEDAIPEPEEKMQARQEFIEPLMQMAEMPEPQEEEEAKTLKEKIKRTIAKAAHYAPLIRKTVASFAEGALKTVAPPISWIVGGLMEVVSDARQGEDYHPGDDSHSGDTSDFMPPPM